MMITCSFCNVAQSLPMYDGVHLFMLVNIDSQISQQSDNKTTKYLPIVFVLFCVSKLLSCFVLNC